MYKIMHYMKAECHKKLQLISKKMYININGYFCILFLAYNYQPHWEETVEPCKVTRDRLEQKNALKLWRMGDDDDNDEAIIKKID